ncbi:PaaX family transcriptional regulator C-terminal domain-containing protein [Sphingoaurantiacus capsulatus]|uniref:PaaX family transcriptional regulator C-terminal domain-containing protein n=1 Tax=Sphingoaurantiacus capsulatus TaxID=1771310 RepID=A0ABV7X9Y7_9SPHN
MSRAPLKLAEIATARPRSRDGSAQGLLLVLLGLFLWRQPPVKTAVLIAALEALGLTENAARKAIHRLTQDGIAAATREGREASLSIAPAGEALFEEGNAQVFGFDGERADWDGRWLVLSVSVPESQRMNRHYLQSRLAWLGMGSPVPGIWISPHAGAPIHPVIEKLGLGTLASSWVGGFGPVGDEAAMVRQAWDIDGLAALYAEFIARFGKLAPVGDAERFVAYVQLVQAWRRFPFIDPKLPARFLPDPWIGRDAAALMRDRRGAWGPAAQRYWDALRRGGA